MADLSQSDRTRFAPRHEGEHVLPNDPLFSKLLRHARRERVCLRDNVLGVTKSYGEVLDAVLAMRRVVSEALPATVRRHLADGDEVFIGILAAGGYEFTVAVLAVLAMGAAIVPMCESLRF
jgi:malonyl-CoA/methylmalonyl-CoA synthetase